MKIKSLLPLLLLAGCCTVSAQTNTHSTELKSIKLDANSGLPIGTLGFPVGDYLTIEGVNWKRNPKPIMAQNFFLVDTVNGKRLAEPVPIETRKSHERLVVS